VRGHLFGRHQVFSGYNGNDRFEPRDAKNRITSYISTLSEAKSVKWRWIRVAAIDIATIEVIWNICVATSIESQWFTNR